jgi:hypothetical protein
MSPEVLSRRALNRALLSRQMLLDRRDLPSDADARRAGVIETVEHLVGLFGPVGELDALVDQAGRLLAFCAPGASPDIRFAPIA